jgi:hypothetical protein
MNGSESVLAPRLTAGAPDFGGFGITNLGSLKEIPLFIRTLCDTLGKIMGQG